MEKRNTLIVGSQGSGKTLFIKDEYKKLLNEGDNAKFVINDMSGSYSKLFFNPETDFIVDFEDSVIRINFINWLESKGNSTIFLINGNGERTSYIIDSILKFALDLKESQDRKVYFILDEFGSLNKMDSIISGLTLGRSFGLCAYISIQKSKQIESIYGENLAETIVNNCLTKVILNISDDTTQEFCSNIIGFKKSESEVSSFSIQEKKEKLVSPSELGLLKDGSYYYKTAYVDWVIVNPESK